MHTEKGDAQADPQPSDLAATQQEGGEGVACLLSQLSRGGSVLFGACLQLKARGGDPHMSASCVNF